jgi:secreted trypsin-like serine protease
MLLFSIIILFTAIRPSYQTIYSCNATASCGCSPKPISVSRIVGGEIAAPQTWTWAVSIRIDNTYLCGGTILSSSWILTAAHCVVGNTASQITVYAGSTTQLSGGQMKVASRIFMHPNYQANTHENDIALLQLSYPLNMNDLNIGVICIPSVSSATLAAGEWPSIGTSVSDWIFSKFRDNFPE